MSYKTGHVDDLAVGETLQIRREQGHRHLASKRLFAKVKEVPWPKFTVAPLLVRGVATVLVPFGRSSSFVRVGKRFFHFQSPFADEERVDCKILFVLVQFHLEPVGEKSLKHFWKLRSRAAGRKGRGNIEALRRRPVRPRN